MAWIGDTLKWSPKFGGCLMWTCGGNDWASQNERDFPTPALAEHHMSFYEARGAKVDWSSLDDCTVPLPEGAL